MYKREEYVEGDYGSVAIRSSGNRGVWNCYESSDYAYKGVVNDFGDIIMLTGTCENLRGY